MDPVSHDNESPYVSMNGNPVMNTDVMGDCADCPPKNGAPRNDGVGNGGYGFIKGVYKSGDISDVTKNAIMHPIETAKAAYGLVPSLLNPNTYLRLAKVWENADSRQKGEMFGQTLGNIGLMFVGAGEAGGAKALSAVGKEGALTNTTAKIELVTVGQWMSPGEFKAFQETGIIPRSNVLTKGASGYEAQAARGDIYAEFSINKSLLVEKDTEKGWSLIKSKNEMYNKLAEKKGQVLEQPKGTNIQEIKTKQ